MAICNFGHCCLLLCRGVFGVVLGVLDLFLELNINWEDTFGINLLSIPIGLLGCYIFHVMLKKRWQKELDISKDEIDDIGKAIN